MGLLHRLKHVHLAGYTPEEYEAYGLAGASSAEARRFASAGQMHNVIRPALNDRRYTVLLDDKWVFARHLDGVGIPAPSTIGLLHPAVGRTWDGDPLRTAAELAALLEAERPARLVAKPVAGRQGRQLVTAEVTPDEPPRLRTADGSMSLEEFVDSLPREGFDGIDGFILQRRLDQHPELAELNPDAINALRVRTLLHADGSVELSRVVLRLGRAGSPIDSFSHGGLSVLVTDLEAGLLGEGIRKAGHGGGSFTAHPDTGVRFSGRAVPCWGQVREISVRVARAFPRLRSVGWDIGVTPDGPVVIEGNPDWELVQSHGQGYLTGSVREQLAALGVRSPQAEPTVAMALRRLRRRAGRAAVRRLSRWSDLDPHTVRWR